MDIFTNKTILITGGTGSFGKRFISRLLEDHNPAKVIILSRDELKQSEMAHEYTDSRIRFFLGDVRDVSRLKRAFKGVDIVVHAAALKQVPAAEYNPDEFIKTNIMGGMNVISAAIDCNVQHVMALSTDKAAHPCNLYGATKLVSDKLFTAANNMTPLGETKFAAVRFGNIAGSRGSVAPLFTKLFEEGAKEVPITDTRMTRFWLTTDQAVDITIEGLRRMHGGEVFVPKIPSIRVTDLAEALAPGLKHKIIGLRPGEVLDELMCPGELSHQTIEFENHYVIQSTTGVHGMAVDYTTDALGDKGKFVEDGFEYRSSTNPHFMTVEEIAELHGVTQKVVGLKASQAS